MELLLLLLLMLLLILLLLLLLLLLVLFNYFRELACYIKSRIILVRKEGKMVYTVYSKRN